MTRYLLRWQLVIMKRQLLTFQGLFPLLMGVALQILFIVLLSTHTSQPIVPYITAIVLYLTIFGIIQVTNSFVQVMLSSSSGLLGIAPVIPQAKVIMALVSLLIVAGLNAGILAGGTGILLGLRYGLMGGLLVAVVLFITVFFLFLGLGSGFASAVIAYLPEKKRKNGGGLLGLIYVFIIPGFLYLSHHDPHVAFMPGRWLVGISTEHIPLSHIIAWLFGMVVIFGSMTLLPLRQRLAGSLTTLEKGTTYQNKTYRSPDAPQGLVRLFLWWDIIFFRRQMMTVVFGVLGLVFMMRLIPGQLVLWWFGILGSEMGAMVLGVGTSKVLPLLSIAPISMVRLWYSRLPSLTLFSLLGAFVFTVVLLLTGYQEPGLEILDGFLLALLGMVLTSFVIISNRSSDSSFSLRKRQVVGKTLTMISVMMAPAVFAELDQGLPLLGSVVTIATVGMILAAGGIFLQRKHPRRYRFAKEAARK